MLFKNLNVNIKNKAPLDEGFLPLGAFIDAYLVKAKIPVKIAICRNNGEISLYSTFIIGTDEFIDADNYYIERLVKFLLWSRGGVEVKIFGAEKAAEYIKNCYRLGGSREFDYTFMANIYERDFIVESHSIKDECKENESSIPVGGHFDGCRIGFDAGGSDRKVSAVIDGEAVYSEEVVWFPKTNSDPKYHFDGIVESFKTAASKMPRVDAIGISSAGVYIDNRTMAASLFIKVPKDVFDRDVKEIYIRAAKEIGDIPVVVANDGDVTALAGAMEINDTGILGIAMGTSQAGGYINTEGNIMGWLNELAFAPLDCQFGAMQDEWSGDIGCGVKYFSQDSVIKLAGYAKIPLDDSLSPADKLKVIQKLMDENDELAAKIYESIGVYLGHSINLYAKFYEIKHILLLGRVMSGQGGTIITEVAAKVLREEYPELYKKLKLHLPDESSRRVGQSVAAASLPKI